MNTKKFFCALLALALLSGAVTLVSAAAAPTVTLNGQAIEWAGTAVPYSENNDVMLPLGKIAGVLGAFYMQVNNESQTMTLNNKIMGVTVGSRTVEVTDIIQNANGSFSIGETVTHTVDRNVVRKNGDVYFPLTKLISFLGVEVKRSVGVVDLISNTAAEAKTPAPTATPAPIETSAPIEIPDPVETPAPDETPASVETPAPMETLSPVETPAPQTETTDEIIVIKLNGEMLAFDVPPQMIDGRIMVPMRAIFEALGAEVEWDADTRTITAVKKSAVVIMQIDNSFIVVNGREIALDVPPRLMDDRAFVPVRAVAEGFDADVSWDGDARIVIINVSTGEDAAPDTAAPPKDAVPIKTAYWDSTLKMTVMLNNPDWVSYKDIEQSMKQVYFLNIKKPSLANCISISAHPFSGDVNSETSRIWGLMKENHKKAMSDAHFEYTDVNNVVVGKGHTGRLYSFKFTASGSVSKCNVLFWGTDEMIYLCTTTASVSNEDEVRGVLKGIIESFKPL